MKANDREVRRKKRILDHVVESGNVAKTCRYFGMNGILLWPAVVLHNLIGALMLLVILAPSRNIQT